MPIDADDLNRRIIMGDIKSDRWGSKLTPEAQEKAADFALSVLKKNKNLNWGQLRDIGIKHVTEGVVDVDR